MSTTTPRFAAIFSMLLAALALASCGGGGGGGGGSGPAAGGGSTPPVPTALIALNQTNAVSVASGATLTGLGASSLGNQFQNALATAPLLPRTHVLSDFIRREIGRLTQNLQSLPPQIISAVAMTSPCTVSGSVVFDQGTTSATETFSACSETAGSSVTGTITIDNMTLDPGVSFSGSAGLNLTFSQTGSPDVTITGSNVGVLETVNVSVNTVTLTGAAIFSTTATNTERLGNYTLVAAIDPSSETDTVTFNYASTQIGGSVDISTVTSCVTDTADNRNFPNSGVLSLAGAGGSKVQVTVNGDEMSASPQVTIGVDANGDGTFETTINKNWADL